MIGNTTAETNFLHEFLLSNKQVSKLPKFFVYYSSANLNLSKTQISKMIHIDF